MEKRAEEEERRGGRAPEYEGQGGEGIGELQPEQPDGPRGAHHDPRERLAGRSQGALGELRGGGSEGAVAGLQLRRVPAVVHRDAVQAEDGSEDQHAQGQHLESSAQPGHSAPDPSACLQGMAHDRGPFQRGPGSSRNTRIAEGTWGQRSSQRPQPTQSSCTTGFALPSSWIAEPG